MAQAVVLAAGLSSRAKVNKLALKVEGVPILIRTVMAMRHHCSQVIVVTGHYRQEVEELLLGIEGVRCVYNPAYMEGMFTSVQCGIGAVSEDFLLTPGDYPLLTTDVVGEVLAGDGLVRVPVSEGRRGHPIFFDKSLRDALLSEPPESNLKKFRDAYPITEIQVNDPGILKDVDTMDDYRCINGEDKV